MFPNVDQTLHLHRRPEGHRTGLDATVTFGPTGQGLAGTVLHEINRPVGHALQILTARPHAQPLIADWALEGESAARAFNAVAVSVGENSPDLHVRVSSRSGQAAVGACASGGTLNSGRRQDAGNRKWLLRHPVDAA